MSDWLTADPTLQATVLRDLAPDLTAGAEALLRRVAAAAGRVGELSWLADRHAPTLRTHDPLGERIDEVYYHPAHRELDRLAAEELRLVAMKYDGAPLDLPRPAPQTLGFAALYLFAQGETGVALALAGTDAAARLVSRFGDEGLRRDLLPRLCGQAAPRAGGAVLLNERAGGSDLQGTQARARRDGNGWRLDGDKWFCTAPDAGVLLVLARIEEGSPADRRDASPSGRKEGSPASTSRKEGPADRRDASPSGRKEGGLGLFAVEPLLPDGSRNGLTIHRLKDKLGVRSVAAGEVSLRGAWARLLGAPEDCGRWLPELCGTLRLHGAVLAVALMRRSLSEGLGWLAARQAAGRPLLEAPLSIESLADLAAETQGALHLTFDAVRRLGLHDEGAATAIDDKVLRLLLPLCKYYTARLAVWAASEAMELQGGNGYVEEFVTPRLLRDAQALPLWQGPTNVCVLEALRALGRPGHAEAILHEAERKLVAVTSPRLRPLSEIARRHLKRLERGLAQLTAGSAEVLEHHGRQLTDALVQGYEVALALSESDRLDEQGDGGRDFLVAERLVQRHLDRPPIEALGPRHIDPLRLQVLLGERPAPVSEVA
jgi:acyl-CoA dehydrogenase